MDTNEDKPTPSPVRDHITRVAGVCDEWCRQWRMYDRLFPAMFLLGVLLYLIYFLTLAAPLGFPSATYVKIKEGQTLADVAATLKEKKIIRSTAVFSEVVKLSSSKNMAYPGEYFFPGPESVITVARRLAHGDFELVPVKVTLPEGVSTRDMAKLLAQKIPDFDTQNFINASATKEGFLFPDTYFFMPGESVNTVISALESNFRKHISITEVEQPILNFHKPITDVVTMASLLEKEAPPSYDRRIIAGILWKRIALGMPLQVDAVFPYLIGKNSFNLTKTDLKTDSPYNTYKNKGLPPGPIANPGLDAILAAVTPVQTKYLYYLSDRQGNFHYSTTYAQHMAYQRRYLK